MVVTPRQKSDFDFIVKFNFTLLIPVLLGLNFDVVLPNALKSKSECAPPTEASMVGNYIFCFSVLALGLFILSNIMVLTLKGACEYWTIRTRTVNLCVLIAVIVSVAGFVLIDLALVNILQIMVCGRDYDSTTVPSFCITNGLAVVFLIVTFVYPLFMEEEKEGHAHEKN